MEKFWLVWRPNTVPQKRHKTLESAKSEAERLSKQEKGEAQFFILECLGSFERQQAPMIWQDAVATETV